MIPLSPGWLIPTEPRKEQATKSFNTFQTRLYQFSCYTVTVKLLQHDLSLNNSTVTSCLWQNYRHRASDTLLTAVKFWSLPPSQSHVQISEPYPDRASQTDIPGAWYAWKKHWPGQRHLAVSGQIRNACRWDFHQTVLEDYCISQGNTNQSLACKAVDSHPARQDAHNTFGPQPNSSEA